MHLGEWLLDSWKPIAPRMRAGISKKAMCQEPCSQLKLQSAWASLHEPCHFSSLALVQLYSYNHGHIESGHWNNTSSFCLSQGEGQPSWKLGSVILRSPNVIINLIHLPIFLKVIHPWAFYFLKWQNVTWPHAKTTLLNGHKNPSSPGQQNPKLHIWSLNPRAGHTMKSSFACGLPWCFLFQNSSILYFALSLHSIFPHIRGSEERVYSTVGFLLRCQANEKWESWAISPWLSTIPKAVLGSGGQFSHQSAFGLEHSRKT